MIKRANLLGLAFLSPAIVVVVAFFVAPVVLTTVFAFTNMSTATGITGGEYQLGKNVLRKLEERGFDKTALQQLATTTYIIDAAGLARAREQTEGTRAAKLLDELEEKHFGDVFESRRHLDRAIKKLKNKPRSARERKKLASNFTHSVLNQRYGSPEAMHAGIAAMGIALDAKSETLLLDTAYTGWRWTRENFELMVTLPATARIALNTVIYVSLTLAFNVLFGLFLAIATFYMSDTPAAVFRGIWFLPRILPPVLYVLLWRWLTWDTGFISSMLDLAGVPPKNWMLDTAAHAWVVVVLINGFVGASMGMILFSSAIRAIPQTMLYASEVDGASRWQQVFHIILPQLRWPILFVTAYQTLSLLTSFEYILLSTDGGPGKATEVWSLAAYHSALNNYAGNLQYGYGAALALVLVAIGICASLFYLRLFNFNELVARPRIEQ